MSKDYIEIKGAKENNLKNVNVSIPRDKLVVLTGLSGSGKSSLAFDTIFAEGQRRYVESLSAYARQFLGQMQKPDVESIDGLSPAVSIDQKTTSKNPRSTVGTVTEIYDYLRLLYANIGIPHCPVCGKPISKQSIDQIVDAIMSYPEGTRLIIMSPIIRQKKGEHQKVIADAKKKGFVRLRVDGIIYDINDTIKLEKTKKHSIEIVVDRLIIKDGIQKRLTDSAETALALSGGTMIAEAGGEDVVFSQNYACPDCQVNIEEFAPRSFSFNSPFGACPTCGGLGILMKVDPDLVIPDKNKSINEGAIRASGWSIFDGTTIAAMYFSALAKEYGFSLDTPIKDLPKDIIDIILYGTGGKKIKVAYNRSYGSGTYETAFEGVITNLERRYKETSSNWMRAEIESSMGNNTCPDCKGRRLKKEVLAVTVGGINISQFCDMPITDELEFIKSLELTQKEKEIARLILKEITERLGFLKNVGLEYLTLSRSSGTLSGGESQRIRLATQIGSSLMGVLYILDEPSIGLHQRDNDKLLAALKQLRDLGNTLIVVEHDEDTMRSADHIIDVGPGAGVHGGYIVAEGTPEDIMACEESITGQYLSGKKQIPVPKERRLGNGKKLTIKGARQNNLKNIDVDIPLGKFVCVTGVSGSGKSSLINEVLYKTLASEINGSKQKHGVCDGVLGIEQIDKVINIDQSPIGRTPRSNPATYTGVFADIRNIFASTNEAKMRGYTSGRFSFNIKGGRCEACTGDGIIRIEMHFLPDVYVDCEVCKGKRYNRETLEVKYKGKNISDVLDMTVSEAMLFFDSVPRIRRKIQTLSDVGLDYIKIGQPSTTLSGGEAQRVKLATELSKRSTGNTVYILDEPTTGLHTYDVHRLINVLNEFVNAGNTVVVIEHNLDVIKTADYIIDMGPEGGGRGGQVVVCGTPEEVAACEKSYTGKYLKDKLK